MINITLEFFFKKTTSNLSNIGVFYNKIDIFAFVKSRKHIIS